MNTDRLLTLATVPVFVGAVAGLYFAAAETLANGWIGLGWWRNIGVTLTAHGAWGVVVGLIALLVVAGPVWWLRQRPRPWIDQLAGPGGRAVTLLVGILAWTVWAEALHLPRQPLTLPTFAAFGWLLLSFVHQGWLRAPRRTEQVFTGLLAAAGFLVVAHGPWGYEALTLGPASGSILYDELVRDVGRAQFAPLLVTCLVVVAIQASSAVTARTETAARWVRWGAVGTVAVGAFAGRLLGMFGGTAPGTPVPVVVIAIDTLRADHVKIGLPAATVHPTTPHLGALAADATVYGAAYSASSWTLPSFASVMTGRYPHEHGAIAFTAWLGRGEATLAERLREAGYATSAVVSHIFVDREHGFDQGFDAFDDALADPSPGMHAKVTGHEVTDRALAWLDGRPRGRPFFLWTHYFDPHYDYLDHADHDFAAGEGWLAAQEGLGLEDVRLMTRLLDDTDLAELRDRYDEEIAYTDAQIGRLLDHPALADALVVVVADHGEAFMERGWLGHTVSLAPEITRVPLIVRAPGGARVDVSTVVEARGVFGTVLDAVGLPTSASALPTADTPGRALSTVWLDDPPGKRTHQAALRTDDHSVIVDVGRGGEATYDRRADPGEWTDGVAVPADLRAGLAPVLTALGAAHQGDRQLSDAEIEQLRALGYL